MEAEPETANEATAVDPLAGRVAEGDPAPREMVERHRAELLRYECACGGGPAGLPGHGLRCAA